MLNSPTLINTDLVVSPIDINQDTTYNFTLLVQDQASNGYTSVEYSLRVGCPVESVASIGMDFADTLTTVDVPVGTS